MIDIAIALLICLALAFPRSIGSAIGELIRAAMDKIESDEP